MEGLITRHSRPPGKHSCERTYLLKKDKNENTTKLFLYFSSFFLMLKYNEVRFSVSNNGNLNCSVFVFNILKLTLKYKDSHSQVSL